jgi:hypothetical protein
LNGWLRETYVKESQNYKEGLKARRKLTRQQLKKQQKAKRKQRLKATKIFLLEVWGKTVESIAKGITKAFMS